MSGIYNDLDKLIGNTPLFRLSRIEEECGCEAEICAKLEYLNPAGSVKDRTALYLINEAERMGLILPGALIVEPTSGNTGIGLCAVAARRGYRVCLVMPDNMSVERQMLMRAYGAQVVLTPAEKGMRGSIERAERIAEEEPNAFIPSQFYNPANSKAHYETTAREIMRDTDGLVDIFVAGVGTGGTFCGTAKYLKEQNRHIHTVAVEPARSAVLSGENSGVHGISGIGAGFVPDILDVSFIDEIQAVNEEDAREECRRLARKEGLLVGISSGAALVAAIKVARRSESRDKRIVVIFPDGGERYLSSGLFE